MSLRIEVENSTFNVHRKEFNVNVEISQKDSHTFDRPIRERSQKYLEEIGLIGRKIVEYVLSIEGVESVVIKPYSIDVVKGKAFDWESDEIENRVLDILRHWTAPEHGLTA